MKENSTRMGFYGHISNMILGLSLISIFARVMELTIISIIAIAGIILHLALLFYYKAPNIF